MESKPAFNLGFPFRGLDPAHIVEFIERLAISGGAISIRVLVRMSRPLLGALTEASADVGEWALAQPVVRASLLGRER